jgi:enoyl-CoA hydratase/carnithine racemase
VPNAVEIEVTDNIAILRFNREDALNALTVELARGIANGLIELDRRDDVRGIVLTGAGERSFCAGVDLREARGV